jgi:membrane-bound lytic murein transglycosylase B
MSLKLLTMMFFVFMPALVYAEEDFDDWKKSFVNKYASKSLPASFIEEQLEDLDYLDDVIEKDRNQLTSSTELDFSEWIPRWLNSDPPRVDQGKKMLKEHAKILAKVERKYGVPKEVIVSLWGVETLYGKITGDYAILEALATLAYDKRRRRFFTQELLAALKIIREGHIQAKDFNASWAGATGQCQFMPTSFLMYAQDFDGDGKKDIWSNHADIFASIANYLKRVGWKRGGTIGVLAKAQSAKEFSYNRLRTPNQFHRLGLRKLDGTKLKGRWRRRVETMPQKNAPYLLPGSNYKALMRWNRSSLFAALNILLIDSFSSK